MLRSATALRSALAALCAAALLQGCAWQPDGVSRRVDALLPADIVLMGEQHDADAHQRLQRALVLELGVRGQLAALALEMADQGRSTAGLAADASEMQVREALQWSQAGWPWERYAPVVMAAVRQGVPVVGANLPRASMRPAMADTRLDAHLPPARLEQQREAIRTGHCGLLPESQIAPMTRIQIARDAAMARTLQDARQPGKTVVLVAGGGHVRRDIGVPTHLPPDIRTRVVLAVAGAPDGSAGGATDMVWETPRLPPKDHCAALQQQLKKG